MQDVVRVYVFTYKDGREVLCVTDLLNVVLFPETDMENRLVEYGRHGEVQDRFDYEVQPAYLELGARTLMRPIEEMDAYEVWPELDHIPTVTQRFLLRSEVFQATLESYREKVYAHRSARKHISHQTRQAIEAFRKKAERDMQAELDRMPPSPMFDDLLRPQLPEDRGTGVPPVSESE